MFYIYKTVSYTNININILFDHRLTFMQTNKKYIKWGGGGLWWFFQDLLINKNLLTEFIQNRKLF